MKSAITAILIFLCTLDSIGQTNPAIFVESWNKEIYEYYAKQYIVEEILKVQPGQTTEVYIDAITASKGGDISVVLYDSYPLKKKGVVFAFWNRNWNGIAPYLGSGYYVLDLDQAKVLFAYLESILKQDNEILHYVTGNLIYKSEELTFLFYKTELDLNYDPIRVWWKTFDSNWSQINLALTIKRFKKFFELNK